MVKEVKKNKKEDLTKQKLTEVSSHIYRVKENV